MLARTDGGDFCTGNDRSIIFPFLCAFGRDVPSCEHVKKVARLSANLASLIPPRTQANRSLCKFTELIHFYRNHVVSAEKKVAARPSIIGYRQACQIGPLLLSLIVVTEFMEFKR